MTSEPRISVVIPAYGANPHLAGVLTALRTGTRKPNAIIVSHSGTDDPTSWLQAEFPEVTALHSPERLYAGAARNRGAQLATSEFIAFCDSDTIPEEDWLEKAHAALRRTTDQFVVGSVGVAETGGYWGMSTWFCEFSEQAPWRPAGTQRGGASCNMAVRAADLAAVGFFPENFRAGQDTLLFHKLRRHGLTQHFDPSMRVRHHNIPGLRHFARHLLNQGRHFAKVRTAADLAGSRAVRWWPLAPLLGAAKAGLVLRRVVAGKGPLGAAAYLPGIVIGIVAWTAGCSYAAATRKFTGQY